MASSGRARVTIDPATEVDCHLEFREPVSSPVRSFSEVNILFSPFSYDETGRSHASRWERLFLKNEQGRSEVELLARHLQQDAIQLKGAK